MWQYSIIEEIHKTREEYARQFNFDIDAICKDIQAKQAKSDREVISFPPRKPRPKQSLVERSTVLLMTDISL